VSDRLPTEKDNIPPEADAGLAGFEGIPEARQPHQGFNTKRVKNAKEARRPLSFISAL
jgi:hypothetical protein